LGAFYGDHEKPAGDLRLALREIITLVGIPLALVIFFAAGVWAIYRIARGWLALRDRSRYMQTIDDGTDPHHDGRDPKTPPKLRLPHFAIPKMWKYVFVEKWHRPRKHAAGQTLVQQS
jgi:hypothetical protein